MNFRPLIGFAAVVCGAQAVTAQSYAIQSLPLLPGQPWPLDLTSAGTIGYTISPEDNAVFPTIWTPEQAMKLPLPEGQQGAAMGGNVFGEIVGSTAPLNSFMSTPALWHNGQLTSLPTLSFAGGSALAVNASGIIVGNADNPEGNPVRSQPVQWIDGHASLLGDFSTFQFARAIAINDSGSILINTSDVSSPGSYLLENGLVIPLTSALAKRLSATSISSSGLVTGSADIVVGGNEVSSGFLWRDGITALLPIPQNDTSAFAFDLNDAGLVVGRASNTGALLWNDGAIIDLNSLLPENSGWFLASATAIDNLGRITGTGTYLGQPAAFLLTPTAPLPEPASLALVLPAFALLLRRRAR